MYAGDEIYGDDVTSGLLDDGCWSCGAPTSRPDGLCKPCSTIDADAVPDLNDPTWAGNTKPLEAIFEAPPNARDVTTRAIKSTVR
jgi:hypothetical protein